MSSSTGKTHSAALKQQPSNSSSLLGALDAISNWRAFVLLGATFIIIALVLALFGFITVQLMMKSPALGALSGFVSFLLVTIIGLIGVNATGIMLADEVWTREPRGIQDSLMASLFTSPRLVAIVLIEALLFLVYLLALAVLLFICKIPYIGPLLYAVVFPVAVVVTGFLIFALAYLAIPLAAPAVWNGVGIKRALVMLKEVARTRLLQVIVMMVLLGLLTCFMMGIIGLILFSGIGVTLSLSGLVIGVSSGSFNLMSMLAGSNGISGYVIAFAFGSAVLILVGSIPGILIGIKGASIIYREATLNLSLDDAEAALDRQVEDIKRRTEAAKLRATTPNTATPASPPVLPVTNTCPGCNAPVISGEAFCGNCGYKLK